MSGTNLNITRNVVKDFMRERHMLKDAAIAELCRVFWNVVPLLTFYHSATNRFIIQSWAKIQ